MNDLRDLLHDSVSPSDPPLRPEPAPETVWRAGRSRRRRRQLRTSAVAAGLALLLALVLVPGLAPSRRAVPAGQGTSGGGYPQRISAADVQPGEPTWPVAGVLTSSDWQIGLRAVDAHGVVHQTLGDRLTRGAVATPDGSRVAVLVSNDPAAKDDGFARPTALQILSSHGEVTLPLTGEHTPTWEGQPVTFDVAQSVWSPDGQAIAVPLESGSEHAMSRPTVLVVRMDGTTRLLGHGMLKLAGWRRDGAVVASDLRKPGETGTPPLVALDATDGREVGRYSLRVDGQPEPDLGDVLMDPSGRALTASTVELSASRARVVRAPLRSAPGAVDLAPVGLLQQSWSSACRSWRGQDPLNYDDQTDQLWDVAGATPRTVVDPGPNADCLQLTSAALAGPQHTSWLGTRQGWLWWHWRVVVAWALVLGLLGLGIRASRRGPDRWSFGRAAGGPNSWGTATLWRGGARR